MTATNKVQFTGQILSGHKQAAVEVPFDPLERWGITASAIWPGRRGHKVCGVFAGVPFESFVVPRFRKFWLLIEQELLEAAGALVGESVAVLLEPLAS